MNTFRTWRLAMLAAGGLVAVGCGSSGGGGGGGNKGSPSSSACEALCAQLVTCATTLGTDVGTLTNDSGMTSANCVSQCTGLTCSNASSFTSCASGVTCSSVSAVQASLNTCANDAGCGGGDGGGGPFIQALVLAMSDQSPPPFSAAEVKVCTDSTCSSRIDDAVVKVNGNAIPWDSGENKYRGGSFTIGAGAAVTVTVVTGGTTYTATATEFSAAPTYTGSTSWTASSDNTISWSGGSPTTGASYYVGVLDGTGNMAYPPSSGSNDGPKEESTSTTSQVVPAGTVAAGSYSVFVGIGTPGLVSKTGGIAFNNSAGGGLWLGYIHPFTAITVH